VPPTENTYVPKPIIPDRPIYIAKALKANPKAWKFFRTLPPAERRNFGVWIHVIEAPQIVASGTDSTRRIRKRTQMLRAILAAP
jgi:hypothetical protein